MKSPPSSSEETTADTPPPPAERSVLTLIRELQAGRLCAATLDVADRRRCVEHLSLEGASVAEIAEILQLAERTIHRDRAAIRSANAVHASPELLGQTVGQLLRQAEVSVNRLRRLGRERDSPASAKVDAEKACFDIQRQTVQTLQSLGYLPTMPTQVLGQLSARIEGPADVPTPSELLEETRRLIQIACNSSSPSSPQGPELLALEERCVRLALASEVQAQAVKIVDAQDAREAGIQIDHDLPGDSP